MSAYLLKQQAQVKSRKLIDSLKTEEGVVENLGADIILKSKDSILMYIEKYYENLYKGEEFDVEYQEWFLSFVNETLRGVSVENRYKLFCSFDSLGCVQSYEP